MHRILFSIVIVVLLCLINVEAKSTTGNHILVLLDKIDEKDLYASFFKSLKDRQYVLSYKITTDPSIQLFKFGERNYDHIINFSPKTKTSLIDFLKKGGNILLAASSDLSETVRDFAREFSIEFDQRDTSVIDHFNFDASADDGRHILIVADGFTNVKTILSRNVIEGPPVLFRGVGHKVGTIPLLTKILWAGDTAYSFETKKDQVVDEQPLVVGNEVGLVTALQARNNARATFVGSLELFSDQFFNSKVQKFNSTEVYPKSGNEAFAKDLTEWSFQEKGVLKVVSRNHHKEGETEQLDIYRIKDDIVYTIEISEYANGKWQAFDGKDVQLELIMLDPYIRTNLTSSPISIGDKSRKYIAHVKLPDVYGVFTLKVNYKRPGYTYIVDSTTVAIRPFRHNEYPRFITAAYPYYTGAALTEPRAPGDVLDDASKTVLLTTQLFISTMAGGSAFLVFCFLRTKWSTMFAPRLRLNKLAPDPLPSSFFGWIKPLYDIPESVILERVGLDAAVLLAFFKMSGKLFSFCSCVAFFDDGPIQTPVDEGTETLIKLISFVVFTWETITARTVMVTVIPKELQTDKALAEYYDSLGFGQVESAVIYRYVRKLRHAIQERMDALRKLEVAYAEYLNNPCSDVKYEPSEALKAFEEAQKKNPESSNKEIAAVLAPVNKERPTMRSGLFGIFGKKIDKIEYLTNEFNKADMLVRQGRSGAYHSTPVGFVTFESITSAQLAAQVLIKAQPFECETVIAPEPRDIYWHNLTIRNREYAIRTAMVNVIIFILVFFWSGPIAFFATFLDLEFLRKVFPWLADLASKNEMVKGFIQGTLPTLSVTVFNIVLPIIMTYLSQLQGFYARSVIEFSTFTKYFIFLLFNVLLVFSFAGTFVKNFEEFVKDPLGTADKLAKTLPQVAPFFINFVILQGIGIFPIHLLQLREVSMTLFYRLISKTPRDYAEANAPPFLDYGEELPPMVLIFVLVLVYSSLAPVILPFGAIYFFLGYIAYKYLLLYVYFHPYETAGLAWPKIFQQITIGLYIYQILMIGYLALRESYFLAAALLPVIIATMFFYQFVNSAYDRNSKFIPLEKLKEAEEQLPDHTDHVTFKQKDSKTNPTAVTNSENSNPQTNSNVATSSSSGGGAGGGSSAAGKTVEGESQRDVLEDDLYHAAPDMYTDYSQPPMTLFDGVLNTGMRNYVAPELVGTLPWLWLPVKRVKAGLLKGPGWFSRILGRKKDSELIQDNEIQETEHEPIITDPIKAMESHDLANQSAADSRIRDELLRHLHDPANPHKMYYCKKFRDLIDDDDDNGGRHNSILGSPSGTRVESPERSETTTSRDGSVPRRKMSKARKLTNKLGNESEWKCTGKGRGRICEVTNFCVDSAFILGDKKQAIDFSSTIPKINIMSSDEPSDHYYQPNVRKLSDFQSHKIQYINDTIFVYGLYAPYHFSHWLYNGLIPLYSTMREFNATRRSWILRVDNSLRTHSGHDTMFLADEGKEIVNHLNEIQTPQQVLAPRTPICFARGVLGILQRYNSRRILNLDKLIDALINDQGGGHKFIVKLLDFDSGCSLQETAKLLSDIDILVTPHGNGIGAALFMQKNTTVISLDSRHYYEYWFSYIFTSVGRRFYNFECQEGDCQVADFELAKKVLDRNGVTLEYFELLEFLGPEIPKNLNLDLAIYAEYAKDANRRVTIDRLLRFIKNDVVNENVIKLVNEIDYVELCKIGKCCGPDCEYVINRNVFGKLNSWNITYNESIVGKNWFESGK
nr:1116_t:CDS:10 [Entrophospora candida]